MTNTIGRYILIRHIPNAITFLRLLLCIALAAFLIRQNYQGALFVYIVEEVLDQADGKLARLLSAGSETGRVFDPFVDTLVHLTAFSGLLTMGAIPLWMFLVILFRELLMGFLRLLASVQGERIGAHWPGQAKALLHAVAIVFSLATLAYPREYGLGISGWMAVAASASVASGAIYLWVYRLVLRKAFAT
ncbi:MAG: CDP-alcohol phosphatidyltransferase family protein [Nitrospirae bacterium]|nr:CDP-alcohol phosphatidyltransferase family protein [Nitrospirota bacterium]